MDIRDFEEMEIEIFGEKVRVKRNDIVNSTLEKLLKERNIKTFYLEVDQKVLGANDVGKHGTYPFQFFQCKTLKVKPMPIGICPRCKYKL